MIDRLGYLPGPVLYVNILHWARLTLEQHNANYVAKAPVELCNVIAERNIIYGTLSLFQCNIIDRRGWTHGNAGWIPVISGGAR